MVGGLWSAQHKYRQPLPSLKSGACTACQWRSMPALPWLPENVDEAVRGVAAVQEERPAQLLG